MPVPLGDVVASLESGARPKGGVTTDSGEVPSLGGEHVASDGSLILSNVKRIPRSFYNTLRSGRLQLQDILVVKDGATTGKTGMVRNEFPFRDAAINEHVFLVRINREKAEPSYVYHFLRSPLGQAAIMLDFRGATVGGISRGFVDKVMLPLPPLPEQRRIAAILDQAEALRAKRRAALAKLAALAQSVFLDMFGDPVRNSKDFPRELLGAVLSRPFQNGAYFPANRYCSDGGVEMVHMSDAFEGVVLRGALKRVDVNEQEKAKYALTQHDLIVARRSLNYLGSVKPCLIPAQTREPLIFESSLIRVTPNDNIVGVPYLYYYLSNTRVRERFVFPFVTQATISGINQQNLAQIQVLLPPRAAQEEFAKRIRELDALMAIHRASLTSFISLFAALQHRAFRGEL